MLTTFFFFFWTFIHFVLIPCSNMILQRFEPGYPITPFLSFYYLSLASRTNLLPTGMKNNGRKGLLIPNQAWNFKRK